MSVPSRAVSDQPLLPFVYYSQTFAEVEKPVVCRYNKDVTAQAYGTLLTTSPTNVACPATLDSNIRAFTFRRLMSLLSLSDKSLEPLLQSAQTAAVPPTLSPSAFPTRWASVDPYALSTVWGRPGLPSSDASSASRGTRLRATSDATTTPLLVSLPRTSAARSAARRRPNVPCASLTYLLAWGIPSDFSFASFFFFFFFSCATRRDETPLQKRIRYASLHDLDDHSHHAC